MPSTFFRALQYGDISREIEQKLVNHTKEVADENEKAMKNLM